MEATLSGLLLITVAVIGVNSASFRPVQFQSRKPLSAGTSYNSASSGVSRFAAELLSATQVNSGTKENFILSPFSVWTVLSLVAEGARGNTYEELRRTLHLEAEPVLNRQKYLQLKESLLVPEDSSTKLLSTNSIFTNHNHPIFRSFEDIAVHFYDTNISELNFQDSVGAANQINKMVERATQNRISKVISPELVLNAQLLLVNAVYFKGSWKFPFNRTLTAQETFYDEQKNPIAKVEMMHQENNFPFAYVPEIKAHVIELPYEDDQFSMIIVLPREGERLSNVLQQIRLVSLGKVYSQLMQLFSESDSRLELAMPKFKAQYGIDLGYVLQEMGIKDAFTVNADLQNLSVHDLFLSKVIHKAEIEVNEEGTTASASTVGSIALKVGNMKLKLNKPFSFFIMERVYKTVLFAGTIVNPQA